MASKVLSGKTCLVTGAGRGIGEAIAKAFAREGAQLALVARSKDQLEATASACQKLGAAGCDIYTADLADGKAIDTLAKQVLSKYGGIDVLVNNAGMVAKHETPLDGDSAEEAANEWDKMILLNLAGPMRLTRHIAPSMVQKGGGYILNVGSVAAVDPISSQCAYAATKHGLRGWSRSIYEALRHKNIKVVALHPGFVNTGLVGGDMKRERMLQPDDIAEAAMLALRTSPACVPEEVILRLTLSPMGE